MNQEPLLSAFTRLRDNLLSMSRHILQNEDDASDAIQEAFAGYGLYEIKLKAKKEAAALTVTTTRNICIDQIRKKARFPELDIETNNECDEDNSEKEKSIGKIPNGKTTHRKKTNRESKKNSRITRLSRSRNRRHCQPIEYATGNNPNEFIKSEKNY